MTMNERTNETGRDEQHDADTAGFAVSPSLFAIGLSVQSPRDAASGLPTGKRQHKPLSFMTSR